MLKYFAVRNFRSIREECILELDNEVPQGSPWAAHTTIGIAGANASGKSNLLQALTFTFQFMGSSFLRLAHNEAIPLEAFHGCENESSHFHLIFETLLPPQEEGEEEATRVELEYQLEATSQAVVREQLCELRGGQEELLYLREKQLVTFGKKIPEFGTQDLRQNASVLALAAQFKSQRYATACKNYTVHSNINAKGLSTEAFGFDEAVLSGFLLASSPSVKHWLIENLVFADLGIVGLEQEYKEGEKPNNIHDVIQDYLNVPKKNSAERKASLEKLAQEFFSRPPSSLSFSHRISGQKRSLSASQQSKGTLQYLGLLVHLWSALMSRRPSLLLADELELHLHPELVAFILGLFQNEEKNQGDAQLLFSFHNSQLMNYLEPSQLWFTQKKDSGETELYSAADFEDLQDLQRERLERLYRIGRFGAKPRGL